MRLFRLSWFNIKKHKFETASLVILLFICMALVAAALNGIFSIEKIFDYIEETTGRVHNIYYIDKNKYYDRFEELLQEDDRVMNIRKFEAIFDQQAEYINSDGEKKSLSTVLITEENENKFENVDPVISFDQEVMDKYKHPIYAPFYVADTLGKKVGDEYDLLVDGNIYDFTIAGFYETGLFSEGGSGVKFIISEEDYRLISLVMPVCIFFGYDVTDEADEMQVMDEIFLQKAPAEIGSDALSGGGFPISIFDMQVKLIVELFLGVMIIMAVVILAATLYVMQDRIKNDIEQQIVSIGVLEALGYTMSDIIKSYIYEYLMVAGIGVVLGFFGSFILGPMFFNIGCVLCGHRGVYEVKAVTILLPALLLTGIVCFMAYRKAVVVKKYPPVVAFRNGTEIHTFKKNRFPLEKTKFSVHFRLALKGLFEKIKPTIGLIVRIIPPVIAIVVCYIMSSFYSDPDFMENNLLGMDFSDLRVEVQKDVDIEGLRQELLNMPEVRNVNVTSNIYNDIVMIDAMSQGGTAIVYKSFDDPENIRPQSGRYPEHDNELMLTKTMAVILQKDVGDTIVLNNSGVKKSYVISGLVASLVNGSGNMYFLEEGYKRINPTYEPTILDVFFNDGEDRGAFEKKLNNLYGKTIIDMKDETSKEGSYEDRIKNEADKLMATMIAAYGVDSVDYSIVFDDQIISGTSERFKIKSISSLVDIAETQLANSQKAMAMGTTLFMVIAVVVIMIIVSMIIESTIKRLKRELGIMKALGYTYKELTFQVAFRLLPAVYLAVILGTVISIVFFKIGYGLLIGAMEINVFGVIMLDLIIMFLSTLAAFIRAGRIKNISVVEMVADKE